MKSSNIELEFDLPCQMAEFSCQNNRNLVQYGHISDSMKILSNRLMIGEEIFFFKFRLFS